MRAPPGSRRRVPVLAGLAAVALAGAVALASREPAIGRRGDPPAGTGWSVLVDAWWALVLLTGLAAAALTVTFLWAMRGPLRGDDRGRRWSLVALLVIVALVALMVRFRPDADERPLPVEPPADLGELGERLTERGAAEDRTDTTGWWLLGFVVAAGGAGALLAVRARRRAGDDGPPPAPPDDDVLPTALGLGIEALHAERDPRRAVIAAYARVEAALAAGGRPRRASETPSEYLARLLAGSGLPPDALVELTRLYERARFDTRPLPPDARERALAGLEAVERRLRTDELVAT